MKKIGIIGAGAMGAGIAQVAATAGHSVVLCDLNYEAVDKAQENIESMYKKLVEKKKISDNEAKKIVGRIDFIPDINVLWTRDFIIEAIVEDLNAKQSLFSTMEKIVPKECVLATNTSSLSIASIASACNHPERVLGIHFFNPAPLMPLVEIIPGILSDAKIVEESKKLIDSWGKVTVLTKDTPGFIVNRVARSFYSEAIRIYEEGMADFATIDWAMKENGFKMGPFELIDFIGNDINYKVTESVWTQFFFEPRFKPSLTQKRLYEAKLFGRKSGRGYYNYAEGIAMPEPTKNKGLGDYIFNRIICMLINEAIDSFYLQLATKEDLDLAMTKGVNYPKGLLKWADELGLDYVLNTLDVLYELYGEDRYRPCVLLKMMVKDGTCFYK